MIFDSLTAVLRLRSDDFEQGAESAEDSLDSLSNRAANVGQRMQSAGAAMTAGITAPLVGVAALSIRTASRVEESTAKMEAVFGDLSGEVVEWSKTTGDALNRSRFELQRTVTNFADLLVPMGASRKEAVDLSTQLTTLTQDLSSFNNVAAKQVQQDLQSALVGQSEAVRKYGIDVSQTAVNQELLRTGMAESAEEATRMEEAQARLNIIMRDSEDALGNARKTSGSFKNQLRGLKGEARAAGANIGQELLPAATLLLHRTKGLIEDFNNFSEEQQHLVIAAGGLLAVIPPVIAALGTLGVVAPAVSSGFATLTGAVGTVSAALTGGVIPAALATQVALGPITVPVWAIIAALGILTGAVVGAAVAWQNNVYGIRDTATDAFQTVRGWLQAAPGWLLAAAGPVGQLYLAWRENLFGVRDLVGNVFGWIGSKIDWLIQKVNSLPGIDDVLSVETDFEQPPAPDESNFPKGFDSEAAGKTAGNKYASGFDSGMSNISGDKLDKLIKKRDALAKKANQADLDGNEDRGDELSEQVKELSLQIDKLRKSDDDEEISLAELPQTASGSSKTPAKTAVTESSGSSEALKKLLSEVKKLKQAMTGERKITGEVKFDPSSGMIEFVDARIDRKETQNFEDYRA
jgi:VIT1/CCC1 family predicted Fe2+/Mn2+ transporter